MKSVIVMALSVVLFACNSADENSLKQKGELVNEQVQLDKNVMELIKSAEESGDKRFLATSGRRVTFPGISEEEEYKVKLCGGYRFMEETGDVISNEKQRENRKQTIEIMAEFNRYMLKHCNVNE